MKDKKLEDFIRDGKNFLYSENQESEMESKERIINFCKKNGLDKKFDELIAKEKDWKDLSEKVVADYVVCVPKKCDFVTSIELMTFDMSFKPTPVIKITAKNHFLL